jgi:hypothetical protein
MTGEPLACLHSVTKSRPCSSSLPPGSCPGWHQRYLAGPASGSRQFAAQTSSLQGHCITATDVAQTSRSRSLPLSRLAQQNRTGSGADSSAGGLYHAESGCYVMALVAIVRNRAAARARIPMACKGHECIQSFGDSGKEPGIGDLEEWPAGSTGRKRACCRALEREPMAPDTRPVARDIQRDG